MTTTLITMIEEGASERMGKTGPSVAVAVCFVAVAVVVVGKEADAI